MIDQPTWWADETTWTIWWVVALSLLVFWVFTLFFQAVAAEFNASSTAEEQKLRRRFLKTLSYGFVIPVWFMVPLFALSYFLGRSVRRAL